MHGIGQSNMRVAPTFLYIGAAKAGSTWIYATLREHPEVYIPLSKRTFYFDKHYACGLEWYLDHFRPSPAQVAVGEICHDYFLSKQVATRVRETIPNVRLICCLRNPIERLLSAYLYEREHGHVDGLSFAAFVRQPHIVQKSSYHENLVPFFERFSRDQILILFYDDLCLDPRAFYMRVCTFIGVTSSFQPKSLNRKVFVTRSVRFPRLAKYLYARLHSDEPEQYAATLKNSVGAQFMRILEPMMYRNLRLHFKPDRNVLEELDQYFLRDYPRLEQLLGCAVPRQWYQQVV